jgi:hypothetical protein
MFYPSQKHNRQRGKPNHPHQSFPLAAEQDPGGCSPPPLWIALTVALTSTPPPLMTLLHHQHKHDRESSPAKVSSATRGGCSSPRLCGLGSRGDRVGDHRANIHTAGRKAPTREHKPPRAKRNDASRTKIIGLHKHPRSIYEDAITRFDVQWSHRVKRNNSVKILCVVIHTARCIPPRSENLSPARSNLRIKSMILCRYPRVRLI